MLFRSDLNGLKIVNDTYGHLYGDDAIKTIAQKLLCFFSEEEIFRISGDEFVVIWRDCSYNQFEEKVQQLRLSLKTEKGEIAALGSVWSEQAFDLKQMIHQAEEIMYVNKQKFYEQIRSQQGKYRPSVLDSILQAIELDSFRTYLQPKANLMNGEVCGAEALVRRIDGDGKVIMPFEFINLLEKERLIHKIDFWVLEQVCQCLKRWRDDGRRTTQLFANITRVTLSEVDLI